MNDVRRTGGIDVIIVGAGPAGSTLAGFLGRQGIRVLLLDRARFPRSKPCGEYMSPEALRTLERLGVLDAVEALPHRKLGGMKLHNLRGDACVGRYRAHGEHEPFRPYGIAIRRYYLDQCLLEHARSYPSVEFIEGFKVTDVLRRGGAVVGVTGRGPLGAEAFDAPLVVAADGCRSLIADRLELSDLRRDHLRYGLVQYVRGMPHEALGELHLFRRGYFALAPVDQDVVNVNLVVDRASMRDASGDAAAFFSRCLEEVPSLAARVATGDLVERPTVTGPLARTCRAPTADGVLLLGDAADFVDPLTGEGLYMAIRSADLAESVVREAVANRRFDAASLAPFAEARGRAFRSTLATCWRLQRHLHRQWLADHVIHRLAKRPALADRVVAMAGDFLPPHKALGVGFFLRMLAPAPRVRRTGSDKAERSRARRGRPFPLRSVRR